MQGMQQKFFTFQLTIMVSVFNCHYLILFLERTFLLGIKKLTFIRWEKLMHTQGHH
jgi:hypothetical protein